MSLIAIAAAVLTPPTSMCDPDLRPSPQTAIGRAAPAYSDALGDVWEIEEVSCWRGTWLRRGKSRRFDAYWVKPDGSRERARLEMWFKGSLVVLRAIRGQENTVGTTRRWRRTVGTSTGTIAARGTLSRCHGAARSSGRNDHRPITDRMSAMGG
jgi:hypothetical protein